MPNPILLQFFLLPLIALTNQNTPSPLSCCVTTHDYAGACYSTPLPSFSTPISSLSSPRATPWGAPSLNFNSSSPSSCCCTSLAQIRAGIDAIDTQLVALLAQRAGYVREATRFKSSIDDINVPARNDEVMRRAIEAARAVACPETLARAVFEIVLSECVAFEICVFERFAV